MMSLPAFSNCQVTMSPSGPFGSILTHLVFTPKRDKATETFNDLRLTECDDEGNIGIPKREELES